jgi:hypothetical protein
MPGWHEHTLRNNREEPTTDARAPGYGFYCAQLLRCPTHRNRQEPIATPRALAIGSNGARTVFAQTRVQVSATRALTDGMSPHFSTTN